MHIDGKGCQRRICTIRESIIRVSADPAILLHAFSSGFTDVRDLDFKYYIARLFAEILSLHITVIEVSA